MKGVILAGGTGTRLKPLTEVLNKHLLPVGPYPMIYWPIIRLKKAGIKDILIVTNQDHLSSFIALLGLGEELGVNIQYHIQKKEGGGIADALMGAKPFVLDEKFIVLLGDNVFEADLSSHIISFKQQRGGAKVLLKKVDDPTRYGVPKLDEGNKKILGIIEKPKNPPSDYCVTGIYMYDPAVFSFIDSIEPSSRNELEITDVNNLYISKNQLQYDILQGWWIDAGTHKSLHLASKYVYGEMEGESWLWKKDIF